MTTGRNPFEAIFDGPANRAREAAYQQARAVRRIAFLAGHAGDESAAFHETEMEGALRAACESLTDPEEVAGGLCRLAGWDAHDAFDDMPAALCDAVTGAWPLPATIAEAWTEFQATETRTADRQAFADAYEPPAFLEARQRVVEEMLNGFPARGLADLLARLSWLQHLNERGAPRVEVQRERLGVLRADVERIMHP